MTANEISRSLRALGSPAYAEQSKRFFKTGPGDYGEGDQFLGIRVPVLRKEVGKFEATEIGENEKLLASAYHEERLFALLLLVRQFSRGSADVQETIYRFYLTNTRFINNWDLVDLSAYQIVGAYLEKRERKVLYQLAQSDNLWERRIAIIATFHFIRKHDFEETLKLAELLIHDPEDLIHKAVGWMLREVGKRNATREKAFLKKHYQRMPRTMLRYAIERFPEAERKHYLNGTA